MKESGMIEEQGSMLNQNQVDEARREAVGARMAARVREMPGQRIGDLPITCLLIAGR